MACSRGTPREHERQSVLPAPSRWLDNDNGIAVHIGGGGITPIKLVQRKNGGPLTTLATGSPLPVMTNGCEYTAKVVIGPDAGSGQNLKFYIAGSVRC